MPLLKVILFSQVANGVLLPFVLFYMLMLINRKRIMQEYTNNLWQNVIAWSTAVVMIALTAALVWTSLPKAARHDDGNIVGRRRALRETRDPACIDLFDDFRGRPVAQRGHQFRQAFLAEIFVRSGSRLP